MSTQQSSVVPQAGAADAFRSKLVESLTNFRQEWEEAVSPAPLETVQAPVALLLADVMDRLGLNKQEKKEVLGASLYRSVETAVSAEL